MTLQGQSNYLSIIAERGTHALTVYGNDTWFSTLSHS
jgi:hypothetical protein